MTATYIPADAEPDRRTPPDKSAMLLDHREALGIQPGSYADSVLKFMIAMDQIPHKATELVSLESFKLGEKLISEEVGEMSRAWSKFERNQSYENAAELLDGAADVIYVILWAMNKFSLPIEAAFAEVQRSNMAKLNPDGSVTKNEHGKVQKPATWTPPDILGILMKHRDDAIWKGNIRIGDKK